MEFADWRKQTMGSLSVNAGSSGTRLWIRRTCDVFSSKRSCGGLRRCFMALNISKTLYYLLRYCRLEPNLRFYYPEKQWSSLVSTIFGIWSADGVTPRGKEIFYRLNCASNLVSSVYPEINFLLKTISG